MATASRRATASPAVQVLVSCLARLGRSTMRATFRATRPSLAAPSSTEPSKVSIRFDTPRAKPGPGEVADTAAMIEHLGDQLVQVGLGEVLEPNMAEPILDQGQAVSLVPLGVLAEVPTTGQPGIDGLGQGVLVRLIRMPRDRSEMILAR